MIISHKHKFIFIKTRKTAGTSVEIELSRLCGEDDIITPLVPDDEQIRRQYTGGIGSQNWDRSGADDTSAESAILDHGLTRQPAKFYAHMSAREIVDLIPKSVWNNYYKFTIERNSFSKVVSGFYWYISRQPNTPKFSRFVNSKRVERLSDFSLYSIEGKGIVADKVIQYDDLVSGFNKVLADLGLPHVSELPRTKVRGATKLATSKFALYSPALVDRVASVFHREIAEFGYAIPVLKK